MLTVEKEKGLKEFGAFLREARENAGLYQTDVAKKVGISRGYYAHIENGTREVNLMKALEICCALDLSISDFEKRME